MKVTTLLSTGLGLLLMLAGVIPPLTAAETPPPPPAFPTGLLALDEFKYASAAEAQAAWAAQDGTAPVKPWIADGHAGLELFCNYAGTNIPRAFWDLELKVDLALSGAICFDIYPEQLNSIGSCNIYFKSGDGWYRGSFYLPAEKCWTRIRLLRSEFGSEDSPAGWSKIERIRIGFWANGRQDARVFLANLAAEDGRGAQVLLLRRSERPREQKDPGREWREKAILEHVRLFEQGGIAAPLFDTAELTPQVLGQIKVAVLIGTAELDDAAAKLLTEFVQKGGKLIASGNLPPELAAAMDIKAGAYRGVKTMGEIEALRFGQTTLPGVPSIIQQSCWGVNEAQPLNEQAEVLAWWQGRDGADLRLPAVIVSPAGAYVSAMLRGSERGAKSALLRALVLRLCPDLAPAVYARRLALAGEFLAAGDWAAAVALVQNLPEANEKSRPLLAQAQARYEQAGKSAAAKDFAGALAALDQADDSLLEAYASAQQSRPGEVRAIWCHNHNGIPGWSWEEAAEALATAGLNNLFVNMVWGMSAGYPSQVLARHQDYGDAQRDYLQDCIAACHKRGIKVHVWMVNWQAGHHAPPEVVEKFQAEGRTQITRDGEATKWLCPSHPANQQLQLDAMLEAARMPGVDGIQFDYIRYHGPEVCFCPTCRKAFETRLGRAVAKWPQDVDMDGPLYQEWVQFRCDNITRLVKAVHDEVKRVAPQVKISADVFNSHPECRVTVGQDWRVWVEQGYLDFVCPMNYTGNDRRFEAWTSSQLQFAGKKMPLYPGIGSFEHESPANTIRQIRLARELQTPGWTIFDFSAATVQNILPYLPKGITVRPVPE